MLFRGVETSAKSESISHKTDVNPRLRGRGDVRYVQSLRVTLSLKPSVADFWQFSTSPTTKNYAHWWLKNSKHFKLNLVTL